MKRDMQSDGVRERRREGDVNKPSSFWSSINFLIFNEWNRFHPFFSYCIHQMEYDHSQTQTTNEPIGDDWKDWLMGESRNYNHLSMCPGSSAEESLYYKHNS